MGYLYDVFVSYPRRKPVGDWVNHVLYAELQNWLPQHMPRPPKVFIDTGMDPGSHWPSHIEDALRHSACMLSVLCPPYFWSSWCTAEWESMRAREQALGLARGATPGLIFPVVFADGKWFPDDAKAKTHRDLTPYNALRPGLSESEDYRQFRGVVQELCELLVEMRARCPDWSEGWPIVKGPPQAPPTIPFPEL